MLTTVAWAQRPKCYVLPLLILLVAPGSAHRGFAASHGDLAREELASCAKPRMETSNDNYKTFGEVGITFQDMNTKFSNRARDLVKKATMSTKAVERAKSQAQAVNVTKDTFTPVLLNLYDLGGDGLEDWRNRVKKIGAGGLYHVAIEVFGLEFAYGGCYGGCDDSASGMYSVLPFQDGHTPLNRQHYLGETRLTRPEVQEVLLTMVEDWKAKDYKLRKKNCIHFSLSFCTRLIGRQCQQQCGGRFTDVERHQEEVSRKYRSEETGKYCSDKWKAKTVLTKSLDDCQTSCTAAPSCLGFSFKSQGNQCVLCDTTKLSSDQQWSFFFKQDYNFKVAAGQQVKKEWWNVECKKIPKEFDIMKLEMGDVVDYFRPVKKKSMCTMLTSTDANKHQWSNDKKDGKDWQTPTYFKKSGKDYYLGGSASGYPAKIDGRTCLSFWGGNGPAKTGFTVTFYEERKPCYPDFVTRALRLVGR